MSSQGAKVIGTVTINAPPPLSVVPDSAGVNMGYVFDKDSIRDTGEWVKYKKQLLVFKEDKTKNFQDPFFAHGNDYRLTWMQGRSKQPTLGTCNGCTGSAFSGNGPF